jgi:hypothetical protein
MLEALFVSLKNDKKLNGFVESSQSSTLLQLKMSKEKGSIYKMLQVHKLCSPQNNKKQINQYSNNEEKKRQCCFAKH